MHWLSTKRNIQKNSYKTIWHLEEPINHPHTVQLLVLSRLAREFVTVVLTGEEQMRYSRLPRYKIVKLGELMRLAPAFASKGFAEILGQIGGRRLAKLARNFGKDETEQAIINAMFAPTSDMRRLFGEEMDFQTRRNMYDNRFLKTDDSIAALLYYDQQTILPSLLSRLDRTSMAASVEARVPFLDYRLVEWSYKLRSSSKIRRLVSSGS